MKKDTYTIEPTETLRLWLEENDYHDPVFIPNCGWYAFKGNDVMPIWIHLYILNEDFNRQRIHPYVNLLEENL